MAASSHSHTNGSSALHTAARTVWPVPSQRTPGLQATVVEVGDGLPIVFLHGLVGLNEHWEGVVERVCHRTRCILFELPLLSLRGDEECSIHGVVRQTVAFLREAFSEPVVLVGNSFGGHVALRIALDHAPLCRGLVLAGASGLLERTMVKDTQIHPSREWLRRKIGELFFDKSFMKEADLDRAHLELNSPGGARAMVRLSRTARRDHLGEAIAEITKPTLLIWGRQDVVTPPQAAEEFHERIRDSRLVWFDACGHAPMIEKPAEFSEAVLAFVDDLEQRARA